MCFRSYTDQIDHDASSAVVNAAAANSGGGGGNGDGVDGSAADVHNDVAN